MSSTAAPTAVTVRNFQIRRSFVAGFRPPTTDPLLEGEIFHNFTDRVGCVGIGSGGWLEYPLEATLDTYLRPLETTYNAAFARACADLPAGGVVRLGRAKTYNFTAFTIPKSVHILGNYEAPPFPGTNQSLNLNSLQSIRIQGGGGVSIDAGGGISKAVLCPAGMSFPQQGSSAWTDTALTAIGDGTLISNCLVLGFKQVFSSVARARGIIRHLHFDCDNGLYLENSYDTTRWSGIHCWPFATIEYYASTFGKLPDGDPNKTVDGYDKRPNLRSGFGMRFRGSNDDTHVDDAILVGFVQGYDLASTGAIYFGRIWSECYAQPGSIGFQCGKNVTNVHIADAQLWSSAAPLLLDMNSTEKVTFGNLRVVNSLFAPITIKGGNLAFATATCIGTPATASIINIVDSGDGRATQSQVSGVLWDETFNTQQPAVLVPVGYVQSNLDNLKIRSTRPAGTTMVGGNVSYAQYLAAAQTVLLPVNGDAFNITGTTPIEKLGGGFNGRVVRLQFKGAATLSYTGAAGGGLVGSIQGVASRVFAAGGIAQFYYDGEYGNWREMFFKDNSTPGGGATTDASQLTTGTLPNARLSNVPNTALAGDPAWTAFTPTLTHTGGGTPAGLVITAYYLKRGTSVQVNYHFASTGIGSASGVANLSLPFAAARAQVTLVGADYGATGRMMQARPQLGGSTTMLDLLDSSNANPFTTANAKFTVAGVYEAAS